MKKVLAMLLLLAMLVPMCVVAQAEETAIKPFYIVNMTDVSATDVSYVYTSPMFWSLPFTAENPKIKVLYGEVENIYGPDEDIPLKAATLKAEFDAMPEGTRYIFFEPLWKAFHTLVEDGLYMEKGVALIQEWLDMFLKEYKSIGGQLDGLLIDLEYEPAKSWFIFEWLEKEDPYIYTKIVQNPKYQTLIRPHLVERGFKFYETITETTSEIYSIQPNSGEEYTQSRTIWDNVIRDLMNQYINQAVSGPLLKYYPDASFVDYQSKNTQGWLKEMESGGGMYVDGGNINHTVGNRVSEDTYSTRPSMAFFKGWTGEPYYSNVTGFNNAVYANTPYNCFLMDANLFKTTAKAAGETKCAFWIADWRYNVENQNSVSRTPYYTETVFHLAMLNPDPIFGYIIPSEIAENPAYNNTEDEEYLHAIEIADDIMTELNRVLGAADRKAIHTYNDWNSKFVVSGMYAGGKNYWRVTPDTSVVSVADFKVADAADPTFFAAGKTITFPGGRIIEDGPVREVGTCGYWVETAADVSPIVTAVDDYYRQYPAYAENFDLYQDGTDFNSTTVQPAGVWETKKASKSSGIIQNGALAIKGNFTLNNVKLPQNINAVDVYAKRQGWEVDVTVPADMAADAEIVLLNCVGKKAKSYDVGMKIAGGKLYYDNAGQYVELADVTPGSKYTVKRMLDMTVDGAFISDYYVYDATGALLASAEDIPLSALVAPISSIGISCKDVMGEPVVLDNYKIYIADINTNFELYDAANGMMVKDITTARDKDTAYRFTWVNATSKERSYSVVAAYYNGDTLVSEQVIKDIKVAPNTDGVETGIVKNETAGQTVLVYLKDNTLANDKTDGGNAGGSNNIDLLLIVCAVVLVLVFGVVVALLASMNKKKRKIAAQKAAKKAPKTDKPSEE